MARKILGWVGMALILGAYFLNVWKVIPNTSNEYRLMNIAGSTFVAVDVYGKSWAVFALQLAWIAVTLSAYVRG